ncbi:polysaccharide deacetylase family protein [Halosimplex halobium]|uniref:polysaccharide deacetylase family protein n=1 Tax=Halosimplex halobium TaxID=3396618 RepID=UPI003F555863
MKLDERHSFVSTDAVADWVDTNSHLPDNSVFLTFDDGYRDFVETVLPILERYEVPATVYVSTKLIKQQRPPFDYLLQEAISATDWVSLDTSDFSLEMETKQTSAKRAAYNQIRSRFKYATAEERRSVLDQVKEPDMSAVEMLTQDQIKMLSDHPLVTVGSHGHEHVPLDGISKTAIKHDVSQSKSYLENLTGGRVHHFSFPYGGWDYTSRRCVADIGFTTAVTTTPRTVSRHDSPLGIPRFDGFERGSKLKSGTTNVG